ncbi:hypothetical protein KY310_02000 [Candidatus Woesearchaeota archaeon]|nr:hypothetical protein [Candidatus Woesearchaeota archaeon]
MDDLTKSHHSFSGIGELGEGDADSYSIAAEQYVAERGVEFREWTATLPSEKPYAILQPGRIDIYANSYFNAAADFDLNQEEESAKRIVEALGILEFVPGTEKKAPIVVCSPPLLQKRFQGPIEKRIEELREKHKREI